MVDELFLTKKLKEVEFTDFDSSVDSYLQEQTDLDKIKEYYGDQGQMDAQLTEIAEGVYADKIYQITTVRGAINAVLGKVREQVYAKLSSDAVEGKIEDGDYKEYEGVVVGAYDFPIKKDDGTTFHKNFMVLSMPDGELKEITCIGDKIGPRRYAVPIPWLKKANYVINPKKFTRANGKQDVDYAAIRANDVAEEFESATELCAIAEGSDQIWDIEKMVDEFPPDGSLKRGDWLWFKGIVREVAPFPIFEGREMTGQYNHLVTYDKYNEPTYALNLSARGKFFDDESFYPTIRLQPTEIGYTDVEWEGADELVKALAEAQGSMDPSDQFTTLTNDMKDRVFYALVKVAKIEQRKGKSRQEGREGEEIDRFFINLNAVYVRFTDEFIPYVPPTKDDDIEKETPPKAKAPAKKPPAKKKPATPTKATEWAKVAKTKMVNWLKEVPDADFETLVDNDVFDDPALKGVELSAIEKIYDDLKKE